MVTRSFHATTALVLSGQSVFHAFSSQQRCRTLSEGDVVVGDAEGGQEEMHRPGYPLHHFLLATAHQQGNAETLHNAFCKTESERRW